MRKIVLLFVVFLSIYSLNAQTPACVPDPLYKDSAVGIYPPPFEATSSPNGGINTPACLGKAYSFRFTLKVSDTITVPTLGSLPIDSISVNPTNGVTGLPTGISYVCEPPSCSFKKNTSGCVVLRGTPDNTNAVKDYELIIKGNLYSPTLRIFAYPYSINFPGTFFPGSYKLKVLAANSSQCITASNDLSEDVESLKNYPNPVDNKTVISINAINAGQYQLSVYNAFGQQVAASPLSLTSGLNTFELATDNFSNGIYIFTLSKNGKTMSNKFIVNH
jgi:Secretion system C-terminal sorting domain